MLHHGKQSNQVNFIGNFNLYLQMQATNYVAKEKTNIQADFK
jgi:hypothetical protein